MSVIIKGMEMPKNCYGCPFFKQVDYWTKNDEADILSKCRRTGEFTWEKVNGYLPNCPLVPVPKHGDLIDRDALPWENQGLMLTDPEEWGLKAWDIEHAPTIIPADNAIPKEG